MKITEVKVYEFELPLKNELILRNHTVNRRRGLLVSLSGETGHTGWGEVSPLPGFSHETFEEARDQLEDLAGSLVDREVPEDITKLSGEFDNWRGNPELSSSVRFGIEMATLNLLGESRKTTFETLISDRCIPDFRANCLVTGRGEKVITDIRSLVDDGYQSIKLKVGRVPVEDDIRLINTLFTVLPFGVAIRLDANRAWSFDDACRFAEETRGCRIEYVEEPLADSSRISELIDRTSMSVALDETLTELSADETAIPEGIKALVLKPTLLGGFEKCMRFVRASSDRGVKLVVSSSFESSLGLAALARFASSLGNSQTAHGLDTAGWFARDIVTEPLQVVAGRIDIGRLPAVADLDTGLLTEVSGD